jgi:hypothetical protein
MRPQPAGCTAAHQPAQAIEGRAQIVGTLAGIQWQQGKLGGDEFPFCITDVA